MQFAAVGLYDSADAIQTKTIMAQTDLPKRFAPPILRSKLKTILWFIESEAEPVVVDFGFRQNPAFATVMPESIGEKLGKYFLQKLRINVQHRVARLNLPGDFGVLLWEIVVNFPAQVFHEIDCPVGNQIGFNLFDLSRKAS